jgi:hypothetical protein
VPQLSPAIRFPTQPQHICIARRVGRDCHEKTLTRSFSWVWLYPSTQFWVSNFLLRSQASWIFQLTLSKPSHYTLMFPTWFQSATFIRPAKRWGILHVELLSTALFSSHVTDTSTSWHFDLPISADDMTVVGTSRKPSLLVSYLEGYLFAVGCNESCRPRVE